jgi:methionyl-tRNA synthetase
VDLPGVATAATASMAAYQAAMEKHQINQALAELTKIVTQGNALVDLAAPWKLAKDPEKAAELDAVLYALAESLRLAAILIAPILPHAAKDILAQLKIDEAPSLAQATWGGLADGHVMNAPTPRFPRIENRE